MKKEYNMPKVEVTIPNMLLMGTESPSLPSNPGSVNEGQGMAPSRKLYI